MSYIKNAKDVMLMNAKGSGMVAEGNFEIYKCMVNGELNALKLFELSGTKGDIEEQRLLLKNEVMALTRTDNSPHVVDLVGVVEYGHFYGVLLEYMPRGNLSEFVSNHKPSFAMRLKVLREIAAGLEYLHHNISLYESVCHNDLNPRNVVLDSNFKAKICDFEGSDIISRKSGLARERRKSPQYIHCCTENYSAPELLKVWKEDGDRIEKSSKMDVFSFSMVIYFMLTGDHPFPKLPGNAVMEQIVKGCRPKIIKCDNIAESMLLPLQDLMQKCWDQEPENRPKAAEISQDLEALMKQVDSKALESEINNLMVDNPIAEEDKSKYTDTFEAFCSKFRHSAYDDDYIQFEKHPSVCDSLIATSAPQASITIELEQCSINCKSGDIVYIQTRDRLIKCKVVRTYNPDKSSET